MEYSHIEYTPILFTIFINDLDEEVVRGEGESFTQVCG